jgi:hypothetical protein
MRRKLILLLLPVLFTAAVLGACAEGNSKGEVSKPFEGYTLYTPLTSNITYLINNDGDVVYTWEGQHFPGNSVYLLENGNLLRTADPGANGNEVFTSGGAGEMVQEFDWEGNLLWEFEYSSDQYLLHHDIEVLPNGNVLMISWEYKSREEAIAAGRDPNLLEDGELWPDKIIEVKPTRPRGGEIIWEWKVWDHLIQDFDPSKENYGNVGEHPELVDINFVGKNKGGRADWLHINSVAYNEALDQIVLSVHGFDEIWVIDHSTTTAEAAGHTGGRSGKGGDLLYRWGNPQTYRAGGPEDQQFFGQHDAEWIAQDLPGGGNILVFNNGLNRQGQGKGYSTVVEIETPLDDGGNYKLTAGESFGPDEPVWEYKGNPPSSFYSSYISGAQRLPNGNTLIVSGADGTFREVTHGGKIVWEYTNPFGKKSESGGANENTVFKAEKYAPDYPGLKGRNLTVPPE